MPSPSEFKVENIHIFPIKSCHSVEVKEINVGKLGLENDRRFMLVDEETNKFITQRKYASLSLLRPRIDLEKKQLILTAEGQSPLELPLHPEQALEKRTVKLWKDTLVTSDLGQTAADWVFEFLSLHRLHDQENNHNVNDPVKESDPIPRARLVTLDESLLNYSRPAHAKLPGVHSPFSDWSPVSFGCLSSLEKLNEGLIAYGGERIPMTRFRNNITISGTIPWEEDHWLIASIGEATFYVVQPIARCTMPGINQDTGKKDSWNGPTDYLKQVRQFKEEPGQGQFCCDVVPLTYGKISVGDTVRILERIPKDQQQYPIAPPNKVVAI
ncbi:MOSC N-terminal beta barrel domain-containing protein [Sporodiniella umbellata]|nr:MOSC N-terminal beta barrel domain-containing protein [Sporodiniella umbellata]